MITYKKAKSKTGLCLLKIKTQLGGFSIETNYNLPEIHRTFTAKEVVEFTEKSTPYPQQVKKWVNEFGTIRQKNIINNHHTTIIKC